MPPDDAPPRSVSVAGPTDNGSATQPPDSAACTSRPAAEHPQPDDKLLQLAAEFENYRKRAQREMEQIRRYGIEQLLRDLLPIVDALDHALAHAIGASDPIVQGVRLIS